MHTGSFDADVPPVVVDAVVASTAGEDAVVGQKYQRLKLPFL